jgi:hypothetical protein
VTSLAEAELLLGHQFTAPKLLAEALTHRSAAGAKGLGSNERLEFIGDRVLGLIIAEWLSERFPDEQEGALGPLWFPNPLWPASPRPMAWRLCSRWRRARPNAACGSAPPSWRTRWKR